MLKPLLFRDGLVLLFALKIYTYQSSFTNINKTFFVKIWQFRTKCINEIKLTSSGALTHIFSYSRLMGPFNLHPDFWKSRAWDTARTYLQLPLRQWGAGNVYLLKVRLSQNEFMKSSIPQNSHWKIWRISALKGFIE